MPHIVYDPRNPCPSAANYDFEEPCPECGDYIPVRVDDTALPVVVCPVCGSKVILCCVCPTPDCCDWRECDECHVIRDWQEGVGYPYDEEAGEEWD